MGDVFALKSVDSLQLFKGVGHRLHEACLPAFFKSFVEQVSDRFQLNYTWFLGDLRWVARFGLMSQISASQIKAPIGSIFQKYVCSTFMVKMRIDLGSQ